MRSRKNDNEKKEMKAVEREKIKKNPPHRPEKPIDWNLVDQLLQYGSPATEVASHFDMHADTLCLRVEKKFGMTFTAFSAERRQKGLSKLRSKQMFKALNEDGDTTMLIWLGKNYLNQRDGEDKGSNPANDKDLTTLLNSIKSQPPLIELQEELKSLREQLHALKQQTNNEFQSSEQALEHMGRSRQIGEDFCEYTKTD